MRLKNKVTYILINKSVIYVCVQQCAFSDARKKNYKHKISRFFLNKTKFLHKLYLNLPFFNVQ